MIWITIISPAKSFPLPLETKPRTALFSTACCGSAGEKNRRVATQRVQKNLAGFGFAAVAPPEIFRKISPPVTRTILSSSKLFRIMNNDVRGHEEGAENVAANGNDSATDAR